MLLLYLSFLLSVSIGQSEWQYAVSCPPAYWHFESSQFYCHIVIVPHDTTESTRVTIRTAEGESEMIITEETRWKTDTLQILGGQEEKGIIVTSNKEVAIILESVDANWSNYQESTQIEPLSPDDREFYVLSFKGVVPGCASGDPKQFYSITSTEDATFVNVTHNGDIDMLVLDLYDTYSQVDTVDYIDMSGYYIISNKPIGLISGTVCDLTHNGYSSLWTSHVPVDKYSQKFIVPFINGDEIVGVNLQILTNTDGTLVDIKEGNDGEEIYIDKGDYASVFRQNNGSLIEITCFNPCNIVMHNNGYYYSTSSFSSTVLPTRDFYNEAVFSTRNDSSPLSYLTYITILADSSEIVDDIYLDDEPFSGDWQISGDYIYAYTAVSQGMHRVRSVTTPFVVYTYATTGDWEGGYGYVVIP